jgi:hypothetical protein
MTYQAIKMTTSAMTMLMTLAGNQRQQLEQQHDPSINHSARHPSWHRGQDRTAPTVLPAPPQQLRQLGDVRRYSPRLIFASNLARSPPRLIIEMDIGQLLPGAVRHDKAGTVLTTKFSTWVVKTEQTRLAQSCSIDMWCRFLETAHELGGDANVLAFRCPTPRQSRAAGSGVWAWPLLS